MPRESKLPAGRTCADCRHIRRCQLLGFTWPTRKECEFAPSRFVPTAIANMVDAAVAVAHQLNGGPT